jgi:glycosyltransferase involved in cell wall biosynthesis
VYNGERTLERALAALVAQDYANLEILVADDRSTDGSLEICAEFARRDRRVKVVQNAENVGLIQNFNQLFRMARGKYFMWADQDDIRALSFVRKTVAALEQDPGAVLCHSHTAAFIGDPDDVKHINTLDGVAGVASPVARYARFLRAYSDTAIYGLIRSDALRRTHLWRRDLGSSNALLFELLLQGTFIQVPEVLYWYSGRGPLNRPSPRDEYARANGGRPMPRYYLPFLVVASNQSRDIRASRLGRIDKAVLHAAVWSNVVLVGAAKLVYRIARRVSLDHVPDVLTRICEAGFGSQAHIRFVRGADRDETVFPRGWAFRRRS